MENKIRNTRINWRFPPDLPKCGDLIVVYFLGHNDHVSMKIKINEKWKELEEIKKWCYAFEHPSFRIV